MLDPTVEHPQPESSCRAVDLEYELVPGVPPPAKQQRFFQYLVHISYEADAELPWKSADGGAMAPFEGGPSTCADLTPCRRRRRWFVSS